MALADIINLINKEKEEKIAELTSVNDMQIKNILDTASKEGEDYSKRKFDEFERLKKSLEKKFNSDLVRAKKIKKYEFYKSISDDVFLALEKRILSLSDEDQVKFFASQIIKISDLDGEIVSKGTSTAILKDAVKLAKKEFTVVDGEGDGGFIFNGDGFTSDFTVSSIVQGEFKDVNEADLIENLFA